MSDEMLCPENYAASDSYGIGDTTYAVGRSPDDSEQFAVWQFKSAAPSEVAQARFHDSEKAALRDYNKRIEQAVGRYAEETGKPYPLPAHCMSIEPSTGSLINILLGMRGNYGSDWNRPGNLKYNRETADFCNQRAGVTKAQEQAMLHGSMFGWGCKAADPRCYDENGNMILNKKSKEKGNETHER